MAPGKWILWRDTWESCSHVWRRNASEFVLTSFFTLLTKPSYLIFYTNTLPQKKLFNCKSNKNIFIQISILCRTKATSWCSMYSKLPHTFIFFVLQCSNFNIFPFKFLKILLHIKFWVSALLWNIKIFRNQMGRGLWLSSRSSASPVLFVSCNN